MDLNTLYILCMRYGVEVSFEYDNINKALHVSFVHKDRAFPVKWTGQILYEQITELYNPTVVGKVLIEEALRWMGLLKEGENYEL